MKKVILKKLTFTLAILLFVCECSYAQWTTDVNNVNMSNTNTGNVGVGTSNPSAKFTVYQALQLGSAINNSTLLSSISGSTTANTFKNNLWLVRNEAGSDWLTARLHDGISIDGAYLTPQLDTRTWWERDPYKNIQSWGSGANTYLTIYKGDVGIGTANPQYPLDVQRTGTGSTGAIIGIQGFENSSGAGGYLRLMKSRGATAGTFATTITGDGFGAVDFMGVNINNTIAYGARIVGRQDGTAGNTYLPGKLSFFTGNTADALSERMTITSSGNVGIGVAAPISDFQIGNGSAALSFGSANSANLHYGTGYIGFNAARGDGSWTIAGNNVDNGGGVIYNDVFGNIYMAPIASNGSNIQTLTDLEIKSRIAFSITSTGIVRAKQIKVETANWPDYVFKKDYQLPSLTVVKTYIDQNQHLPDMPSEQEIAKDGLNLGEMNQLLVKKVEELTLYLIENQKLVQKQQAQIDRLNEQMKSLIKQ
jgi:hypothetical protein